MEKRQQRGLFTVPGLLLAFCWPFAHMFFPALSPDSVDNRITAFE
ncbi:hypothetical protein [Carboxydothermus ferrireducens]|nr:hypothetical protein [Carboxydothermus ferrireducens]